MKKFISSRQVKGQEIIAGKYVFIDGEMPVSDDQAAAMAPMLTTFYGCQLVECESEGADETVLLDRQGDGSDLLVKAGQQMAAAAETTQAASESHNGSEEEEE